MTRFTFESASLIAVGTFNIHIFTPPWLEKCGVLEGDPDNLEFALSRPGFRISLGGESENKLVVDPQRIEIISNSPEFDCGELISKILRRLAETPLMAVGANVAFKANFDEIHPSLVALPSKVDGLKSKRRSASVSLDSPENTSIAVSIEQSERLVNVSGNHETRSSESEVLANASDKFISSVTHLKSLIEKTWGIELSGRESK